jgi:hypothetical protein
MVSKLALRGLSASQVLMLPANLLCYFQGKINRREMIAAGLGVLTAAANVNPANAIFGFGGPSKDEVYQRETVFSTPPSMPRPCICLRWKVVPLYLFSS